MKKGDIEQGYGFYSNIHAIDLTIINDKKIIGRCFLKFNNGSLELIDINAHEVKIMGYSNVLIRQPTVHIEGECHLFKLYTFALLSKNIDIQGYDAEMQGKLVFNITYGDVFTVSNNFVCYGKIISSYKRYYYDELYPLKQSLHALIVICLFYIIAKFMNEKQN
jgi:hypothetical protein